jgi:hypothetical protein
MTSHNTTLYGVPRPKNKPIPLSSTSIYALSTELSLARSQLAQSVSSSKSLPARPRPSKTGKLFSAQNKGVSIRAAKDERDGGGKTTEELGDGSITQRDLGRSRRKMEVKAKIYERLKRGDACGVEKIESEGLVDFDRKWAENGEKEEEEEEEEEEDGGAGSVEYVDEFGRTRMGTKAEAEREKKRSDMAEKERNRPDRDGNIARPPPPEGIIYGNTIQTHAFQTPTFSRVPTATEIAAALPTEEDEEFEVETHYDASKEVRTKGVGFYQFSKDAKVRKLEMEELEKERQKTEKDRLEKIERRKRKREELERRKEEVRNKRRGHVGKSWLETQFGIPPDVSPPV